MKASKALSLLSFLCLLAGLVYMVAMPLANRGQPSCFMDLNARHNEALCAHTGVNPFHVWNGDVINETFFGLNRPDLKREYLPTQTKVVHAYTPWHMAYTWFYGLISFQAVVAFVFFLNGLSIAALVWYFKKKEPTEDRFFYWSWLFLGVFAPCVASWFWGNYGMIIAGLLVLMIVALKNDHQVLAGIAWALMMTKPQVAALFFFPILFQRKYRTILVAALIGGAATLWPAYVYGESPIALVLQVPQIGAPYETSVFWSKVCPAPLRSIGKVAWMLISFVACGVASWKLRSAKEIVFRYAPAALLFTVWTYSGEVDLVVMWPFYLACVLVGVRRQLVIWFAFVILCQLFCVVWRLGMTLNWFSPTGGGWIYCAAEYARILSFMLFPLLIVRRREPLPRTAGIAA